ncbi:MAG: T9SS type A sorting domain-containing protein [Rhizobacter sp.]|nr:T9SS type A sorting domain-containing protein [Ferruginibacter sp.]
MKQLNFTVTNGINQLYINGAELAAGVYLLRLKTGKKVLTQKIIKQ